MKRTLTLVFLLKLILNINSYSQWDSSNSFAKPTDATKITGEFGTLQFDLSGHSKSINPTQWSPDGTKFVTTSGDGGSDAIAIIWSVADHVKLLTIRATLSPNYAAYFNDIQWSSDGTKLLTAATDGNAIIWSATTGEKLQVFTHSSIVYSARWNPDGTKIATGSKDGTAVIWDVQTRSKVVTLKIDKGEVSDVQWSPDGTKLATKKNDPSNPNGNLTIWSASTGKLIYSFSGFSNFKTEFYDFKWSHDGTKIAIACADGTCIIWKENTHLYNILTGHKGGVRSVNWSPNDSNVSSASMDQTAIIWDVKTGLILHKLVGWLSVWSTGGEDGGIYFTSWSPDGKKIITAGGSNAGFVWDVATGMVLDTILSSEGPYKRGSVLSTLSAPIWSPDGKKIAAKCKTNKDSYLEFIWDAETGKILDTLGVCHIASVNTARWSPDGTKVATAGGDGFTIIWNAENGANYKTFEWTSTNTDVQWSPDGSKIVCIYRNHPAVIWDVANAMWIDTIGTSIGYAKWSPDGSKIAIVTSSEFVERKEVGIWDVINKKKIDVQQKDNNRDLRWSPDGTTITCIDGSGYVTIIDPITGKKIKEFTVHSKPPPYHYNSAASLSPDGTKIATLSSVDSTITIWTMDGGQMYIFKMNQKATIMKWSPTSEKIVVMYYDKRYGYIPVMLSVKTGVKLFTLTEDNGIVQNVNWSPDGSKFATSGKDNTAIIWSATNGNKLGVLKGNYGKANDIQWSPHGTRIVTAFSDNKAKIWSIDESTEVKAEQANHKNEFSFFPNPTTANLNIRFAQEITYITTLDIVNILGQQIATIQIPAGTKDYAVSLEGVATGMYLIKINNTVKTVMKW